MRIIFLGPPGSGKGTQAEILAKKLNIPHISTGDIFRFNIKNQTELGIKAKEYMDKGYLVPDEVTNAMVKDRLQKDDSGYILDGYPRTINQAEFLDKIQDIDKVINFILSEDEVVKRISGRRTCSNCNTVFNIHSLMPKKENLCDKCHSRLMQRDDEKPEIVRKRLVVYKVQTQPLLEYYGEKIINIGASESIKTISRKVAETFSL